MPSVYGPLVTANDVEQAVLDTIRKWERDYLRAVALHAGQQSGSLPAHKAHVTYIDLDKYPEDQLPACVVQAPAILEVPGRRAKSYTTRWAVGVGSIVRGKTPAQTLRLAQLYAAAMRTLLIQKGSLGGFAQGTTWIDESYDDALTVADQRTVAAGVIALAVDVYGVVDPSAGPTNPTPEDQVVPVPGDLPVVGSIHVDVRPKEAVDGE